MDAKSMERIFIRLERCVGCRSCELACRVAHSQSGTLVSAIREKPEPRRRIYVEQVGKTAVPFMCRHCEDAPCVRSCPTGALTHDPETEHVVYEAARCIGCHACLMACPFGMIQPDRKSGFIAKCDFCAGRPEPACVAACPTRALVLEKEFLDTRRRASADQLVEAVASGRKI